MWEARMEAGDGGEDGYGREWEREERDYGGGAAPEGARWKEGSTVVVDAVNETKAEWVAEDPEIWDQLQRLIRQARVAEELEREMGRRPQDAEVADRLGITSSELVKNRRSDSIVREDLVSSNIGLVWHIAKKYRGFSSRLDLIQEGCVGLVVAADKFDASKGVPFSNFAGIWIRAYITRALASHSRLIRIPEHRYREVLKMRRAIAEFTRKNSRCPSSEEVTRELNISVGKLNELTRVARLLDIFSIDRGFIDGLDLDGHDVLPSSESPVSDVGRSLAISLIDKVFARVLRPREREVLKLRYGLVDGEEHSLTSIAARYNISKQRVSKIASTALAKLRRQPDIASLSTLLEDE
eukprot:CAMPEP_0184688526 /NCGR_PEP_ID=MMETSP0312-20130426/30146_1 /TAXON_ID=31354 /ORGANISM="Compsopogon coeruleus, Strain SAG 36.94" /LENGTH=353 /DNA_ID=CAMNT_0027145773 /DNA_START=172 /DNA_END=1234 /DNA_ORIENTATION=-